MYAKDGWVQRKIGTKSKESTNLYKDHIVRANHQGRPYGQVEIGHVVFPEEFIGKKVRFKIEVIQ